MDGGGDRRQASGTFPSPREAGRGWIEKLGTREFDRLRAWFEDYQAARFDEKIERDAQAGKLDHLAEQAVVDFRKGRNRRVGKGAERRAHAYHLYMRMR